MRYLNKYKVFESNLYDEISNDILNRIPKNYSVEDFINYMRDRGSDDNTIREVFHRIKNRYSFSEFNNYKPSMKEKQSLKKSNSFIKSSDILSNISDLSLDLIDDDSSDINIYHKTGEGSRYLLTNHAYMNIFLYGKSNVKYNSELFKDLCQNIFEYISNEGLDCIIGLSDDGETIEDCFFNSNKNYRFQKSFTNEYYGNERYCLLITIIDKSDLIKFDTDDNYDYNYDDDGDDDDDDDPWRGRWL